ncbi:arrestin domain-containing protein 3-like [Photinus pyralis]|uniref:arrestin domain-containing protein 3-like n=1 Tax=Photinus pyralis TaxID=7054 RepID=UPI001267441D|nr:arrestin domain-containing protein 3-like [Photinus pyralis]
MAGHCEIEFDKEIYHPGEVLNGNVYVTFTSECTVRDIKLTFIGRAKVFWKEGKTCVYRREPYFDVESSLLTGEMKIEPGRYAYSFAFELPDSLPSTMDATQGSVKYKVRVDVDREWTWDYNCEKAFTVFTCNSLSSMSAAPVECVSEKTPISLGSEGPIELTLCLPKACYAPDQAIPCTATVKNDSGATVNELRFRMVQGFSFHADGRVHENVQGSSDELTVKDSAVAPHTVKKCNFEFRVPADMFFGALPNCNCIKAFWTLKGEACLSFPHTNLHIEMPLHLGSDGA